MKFRQRTSILQPKPMKPRHRRPAARHSRRGLLQLLKAMKVAQ